MPLVARQDNEESDPEVAKCPDTARRRVPPHVRGIVTGKAGKTIRKGGFE